MKIQHRWKTFPLAAIFSATLTGTAWAQPEFEVRGRAHFDAAFVDADNNEEMGSGTLLRRGRLGVDGTLTDDWDFRIEYDFAGGSASANDIRMRRSLETGQLIIGHVKVPMGLNELTSSNSMSFIERSAPSNLVAANGRRLGLGYHLSEGLVNFQTMAYTNGIGGTRGGNDPIGLAGRLVYNPILDASSMVHLGISAAYEDFGSQNTLRLRERPESRPPSGIRAIDTGTIADVSATAKLALEAAYQAGPLSAEVEYLTVDVDRSGAASNPRFGGYHIQASYVLTGEARSYSGGAFGGISPASSAGAWEVAARFSSADLMDSGIVGGKMDNVTLAANYHVSSNLRFMANLILSDVEDGRSGDEDINIFLVRAQYNF